MVKKALVDLEGPVFREFAKRRSAWALDDAYRCVDKMQSAKLRLMNAVQFLQPEFQEFATCLGAQVMPTNVVTRLDCSNSHKFARIRPSDHAAWAVRLQVG